jgi:phage N-6-adenine-methyltransferase
MSPAARIAERGYQATAVKFFLISVSAESGNITYQRVNIKYMANNNISKLSSSRNRGRWQGRGSDWATPLELFNKLDNEFHFTLDVCASDWNAKCDKYFTGKEDGLKQDWGDNICWMNPPYGKALNDWMKKAYKESMKKAIVVCLVPASTDLQWWHQYAMKGEIRFLRGRPRFETPDGKWQQTFSPSVIVVFNFQPRQDKGNRQHLNQEKGL